MAKKIESSPKLSFKYWDVWQFIKGRKKMFITVLTAALAYIVSSNEVASIVAGGLVEMGYSLVEYYAKDVPKKE